MVPIKAKIYEKWEELVNENFTIFTKPIDAILFLTFFDKEISDVGIGEFLHCYIKNIGITHLLISQEYKSNDNYDNKNK